jgi:hypothetical protein
VAALADGGQGAQFQVGQPDDECVVSLSGPEGPAGKLAAQPIQVPLRQPEHRKDLIGRADVGAVVAPER